MENVLRGSAPPRRTLSNSTRLSIAGSSSPTAPFAYSSRTASAP